MMNLMKKVPGGTLLIPMLLSSLIYTFFPSVYDIGGVTKALFSGESLNFVLGSAVFISGCSLNLKTIKKIASRYAPLLLVRLILNAIFGVLFVKFFGLDGVLGVSAIAFICALTSINPTLFLGFMNDYGDEVDSSAFGFISMIATPVVPMFIYGLTSTTKLDFMPIISMIIPLLLGVIVANFDKDLSSHLSSGIGYIIVLLGWNLGASINLIEAISAGLPGLVLIVMYYVLNLIPLYFVETKLMKRPGYSSIALSTIAGLSASVPILMSHTNPELVEYASQSASVITFGVILSSIISSILIRKRDEKVDKNLNKNEAVTD